MTKVKSGVGITFSDGSRLTLGENSIFCINRYIFKPEDREFDIDIKLIKGAGLYLTQGKGWGKRLLLPRTSWLSFGNFPGIGWLVGYSVGNQGRFPIWVGGLIRRLEKGSY